jgi:aspartate racemase
VDTDQEHPEVLYYSMSRVPDRTEAIVNGGPSPAGFLQQGLDLLVRGGADILGIACNTAHHWLASLDIPAGVRVVHIVDAVRSEISRIHPGIEAALVLATGGTQRARIFDQLTPSRTTFPPDAVQAVVERAISTVKRGDHASAKELLSEALQALRLDDTWVVVLGCTELSLVRDGISASVDCSVVDSVDALARQLVLAAGKPLREQERA